MARYQPSNFFNRAYCACQDQTSTCTIASQAGQGTSELCVSCFPFMTNSSPHFGQKRGISQSLNFIFDRVPHAIFFNRKWPSESFRTAWMVSE